VSKKIERLRYRDVKTEPKAEAKAPAKGAAKGKKSGADKNKIRDKIAKRAAKELADGMYCNLGIGIPVVVANSLEGKVAVDLQGENGIVAWAHIHARAKKTAILSMLVKKLSLRLLDILTTAAATPSV
jgi:hypothetical protein